MKNEKTPAGKSAGRAAFGGALIALALAFSWLEAMFPLPIPVPGVKAGLANLVTLFALYMLPPWMAALIAVVRIVLAGLLFGGPMPMLYSLCGFALSFAVMLLLKMSGRFGVAAVSVAGGVSHNLGQLVFAAFVMKSAAVVGYLPALLAGGIAAGALIGALGALVIGRFKKLWGDGKAV